MVAIGHLVLLASSLAFSASAIDDKKVVTKLRKADPQGSFLQKESVDTDLALVTQKQRDAVRRNENLVPWSDGGKEVKSQMKSEQLDQLDGSVSSDSYKATLDDFLSAAGKSRYVKDPGNQAASDYLVKKFQEAGFTVSHVPEGRPGTSNVVAFKQGTDLGHETVLFGAHYDSVNYKTPGVDAPGVDDNGSGVACLLSVAEAMKGQTPRRSMAFVGFNSEEEGLLGSAALVNSVVYKKEHPELGTIKAAIIADEVAFPGRKQFKNQAIFETLGSVEGTQSLVDTFAHTVGDPDGEISGFKVNYDGFGSDHMSFLNAKIPAMLLIERDDEWHAAKVGHSSMDNFDDGHLSMDYGAKMTRLGLRSFAKLANPSYDGAVL
jgi:Zn-dependent M28 family amino/carboxypeptidase